MSGPDLLFGKIAVEQGYVTEADLQECIADQIAAKDPRPLGEILLERGTITRRQMEAILAVQQERLAKENPRTHQRREDTLFGRIAWRMGMLTPDDLNGALRLQAAMDSDKVVPLGELLVREGYLTERQVQSILEVQRKAILYCPLCRVLYALKGLSSNESAEQIRTLSCPRCRSPLREPGDDLPDDAEWVTLPLEGLPVRAPSTAAPTPKLPRHPTRKIEESGSGGDCSTTPVALRTSPISPSAPPTVASSSRASSARADAAPPASGEVPADPRAGADPVACTCPVCEASYDAVPDKFQRVKCPQCRTGTLAW